MADITCKRCSISRVNQLCDLYTEAFSHNNRTAWAKLKKLVDLAAARGYGEAIRFMQPDLDYGNIRAYAWNISSLLVDADLQALGLKIPGESC
ncbi:MAG: hypothetical protein V1816_24420 [Pseudomonadota bacterium]